MAKDSKQGIPARIMQAIRNALTPSIGDESREAPNPAEADVVLRHPVYGDVGWVAVINPGERTGSTVLDLIDLAHAHARARWDRRAEP